MADGIPTDRLARPLRDLRISVTDRCNLRCPYCMPAEIFGDTHHFLPRDELLTFEEIARMTRAFATLGVKKVRFTGGEPLLRRDLPELVDQIAKIDGIEDIALTTNGILLPAHAQALKRAGLRRVTVSLDSLDDGVFRTLAGRDASPRQVLDGIAAAERNGLTPIKINCVVIRGVNDHTVTALARHFRESGHIVRFIEFMDVGTLNEWDQSRVVPAEEVVRRIDAEFPLEPVASSYRGEVARRYRYRDGLGEIGVISSVSVPFCGDCSRVRLTSDGRVLTCLFAANGPSLRDLVRGDASDDEVAAHLRRIWISRSDRYSELRAENRRQSKRKIEMYQVGG
jgi:cyclic pyranopterin phosphate synthase